jgi:hypothetical protein
MRKKVNFLMPSSLILEGAFASSIYFLGGGINMRLWTIQPVEVWNMIQETGVYIADPDKAFCHGDKNCTRAYKWMVTQMEKRIGAKPEGVTYPVWAWHTQEYKHKKPDFRHY